MISGYPKGDSQTLLELIWDDLVCQEKPFGRMFAEPKLKNPVIAMLQRDEILFLRQKLT